MIIDFFLFFALSSSVYLCHADFIPSSVVMPMLLKLNWHFSVRLPMCLLSLLPPVIDPVRKTGSCFLPKSGAHSIPNWP